MGFYDRDYERGGNYERQAGLYLGGPRSLTTNIVLFTGAVYVVQLLTRGNPPDAGSFTELFSLHGDFIKQPWRVFELLTYGFLHDPWSIGHILFNMLTFWFFGRTIEYRYGKQEFLLFFLAAIAVAGLTWVIGGLIAHHGWSSDSVLGASGGISAVLLLFCLNYPHQVIYIWGVLPIPAWVFAILFIGMDLAGTMGHAIHGDANVAFTAHLGGAAFAFIYFQGRWRLERMLPDREFFERIRPKPKLRVHDPESSSETDQAVDDILKKIQEHGRDSLTRSEKRILEEASREYQRRRH